MNIALRKTHFRFAKTRVGIRKQTREKERELKKERERKKHWFTNREHANSLSDEKKKHTKLKSMWLIKLMRYL